MTPEDERHLLYGFRRNLVVVASAGTGKTYALVGVLIHLALGAREAEAGGLEPPVSLARVVATTFSRKAAAEIRARLAEGLTRLASGDPDAPYRSSLLAVCDRMGASRLRDDEIAERARAALDGLSRARIGTLHGFATTIVRAHGLALGLPPEFTVESEAESRDRARSLAEQELEALAARSEREALDLVTLAGGGAGLVDRVVEVLGRLSEDGRLPEHLELPTSDADEIDHTLALFLAHARALEADRVLGVAARSLSAAWASGTRHGLEEAAAAFSGVAARGKQSEAAEAFFVFRDATLPKGTNAERGADLVKLWREREAIVPRAALFKELLVRVESAVRASSIRDGVLGFGDILLVARDVLRDVPGAASALGRELDALLIDELQDTSRIQRELVELAWRDAASDARVPSLGRVRGRGLLVVGDRKQSIYGFRGADVGAFAELCVGLAGRPAREALRIAPGRVWEPEQAGADFVALRHNRRSASEILSFVNAYSALRLRAASDPAELYEVEYAPDVEDLLPAENASHSTVPYPRTAWIRVPPVGASGSSPLGEGEAIAQRIAAMMEEGAPLGTGEPVRWRDFAVLARRHAALDATAYALARAGIPYVVAGNGFFSAREVGDMVAMLAFLLDPDDALARVVVLRGPWCGASDEALLALTAPHEGVLDVEDWDDAPRRELVPAGDRPSLEALGDVVVPLRRTIATIGPAEALRLVTRALSFEETLLLLPRGEQRVANARKVIALADGEANARAFLSRMRRAAVEEHAESEAATFSDEEDAVRLVTVHASKGLDFPIVFLPEVGAAARRTRVHAIAVRVGASDAPNVLSMRALVPDGRALDTPSHAVAQRDAARRDLAEQSRLAYVAVTRARDAIVFVGDRRPPKGGPTDAFRRTTAAVLASLLDARSGLACLSLPVASAPRTRPHGDSSLRLQRPAPLEEPRSRSVDVTATELVDFVLCPRRFQLVHVTRLAEPPTSLPPAKLALESAKVDARSRACDVHVVRRDERFVARASGAGVTVSVEGAVDLWLERRDGSADAAVFSRAPSAPDPRAEAMSAIVAFAHASRPSVRVGVLRLVEAYEEPAWRATIDEREASERLVASATALARARFVQAYPRAPLSTCRAIGCGYVALCHPEARAESRDEGARGALG